MTNVVPLTADTPIPGEPDAGVVSLLEDTLEAARRGEIVGVAMALVRSDGNVSDSWSYAAGNRIALLAGAALMLRDFTDVIRDD